MYFDWDSTLDDPGAEERFDDYMKSRRRQDEVASSASIPRPYLKRIASLEVVHTPAPTKRSRINVPLTDLGSNFTSTRSETSNQVLCAGIENQPPPSNRENSEPAPDSEQHTTSGGTPKTHPPQERRQAPSPSLQPAPALSSAAPITHAETSQFLNAAGRPIRRSLRNHAPPVAAPPVVAPAPAAGPSRARRVVLRVRTPATLVPAPDASEGESEVEDAMDVIDEGEEDEIEEPHDTQRARRARLSQEHMEKKLIRGQGALCGVFGCKVVLSPHDLGRARAHLAQKHYGAEAGKMLPEPQNAQKHGRNKPWPCSRCNTTFKDFTSLRRHHEYKHLGWSYRCPSSGCTKTFSRTTGIPKHMRGADIALAARIAKEKQTGKKIRKWKGRTLAPHMSHAQYEAWKCS
ncbi:uncharacterized protein BXZ73DRAFT_81061 [Epithele typhae]|uniref:uncharacterized protein n=1 Tax=Epithele typhae TaxID=378194 RepID=UPI0020072150|nr:uncharacterized protein BXZ73DRAFT_81061 [Epithele typhae]KAH9916615.1 hypothetical protein BXZ73DRAFT_81061 [Epithele typhae]